MKKQTFSTNINCGSCVRSVTGFLNEVPEISAWEVDTNNPAKILTVAGEVKAGTVIAAVEEAGFDIKVI